VGERLLIFIGIREDHQKLFERNKVVPFHCSLYHRLHPMVARDKGWIDGSHGSLAAPSILWLEARPLPPAGGPGVVREWVDEEVSDGLVSLRASGSIAQPPESQGEVSLVLGHGLQEITGKLPVLLALRQQPELAPKPRVIGRLELAHESFERLAPFSHGLLLVLRQEWQKRLGQPRQIPEADARLVAIGLAALPVDGAEDRRRIVGIHEGARAIIDRLAGDGHVVGVHDPMDEADVQPTGNELQPCEIDGASNKP
jgi:hypothetical protein